MGFPSFPFLRMRLDLPAGTRVVDFDISKLAGGPVRPDKHREQAIRDQAQKMLAGLLDELFPPERMSQAELEAHIECGLSTRREDT